MADQKRSTSAAEATTARGRVGARANARTSGHLTGQPSTDRTPKRYLILDASMGAGHQAVSGELAERLRRRGELAYTQDVLQLLPAGIGAALRGGYRASVRRMPWLYDSVYAAFMRSEDGPGSTPLAALLARQLNALVAEWRPDVVVPVFHLAAQAVGRMRMTGRLTAPTAVVVTDFAVHRQWLHPGNDVHVCVSIDAAEQVRATLGRGEVSVHASGPIVPDRFAFPDAQACSRWDAKLRRVGHGRPAVLLATGAWGVGSGLTRTAKALFYGGYLPVVLCGRDEALRARLARMPEALALGWVEDLEALMAAADALVDNAAGQTAVQALRAGLPVVGYRPIAGHGREGVLRMARIGASEYAAAPAALLASLAALTTPGPARERQIAAGRALFRGDAAAMLEPAAHGGSTAAAENGTDSVRAAR